MRISKTGRGNESSGGFLFYGLLIYTVLFFSQLGSRIPALGAIRIEFIVGTAMLILCIPSFMTQIRSEDDNKIIFPLLWFTAAIFISIPTTVAGYNTIAMLIHFLKQLAVFFMIMVAVKTEKQFKIYILVLVFALGYIILEAFVIRPMHNSSGLMRLNAVTKLFAHPNALGGLAAALLPILYYLFRYYKNLFFKLVVILFMLVVVSVVSLTQSRSALLGVLVCIMYIWFVSKKKMVSAVIILIFMVGFWISLDSTTKKRYSSLSDAASVIKGEDVGRSSMAARLEIILDGIRLFVQRPINGFGVGGYQVARVERLGRWQVCHNAYVQCLSELGVLGFIISGTRI